jgi:hypothetical protein
MACSVVAGAGVLTIVGDTAADHIVVRDNGDGAVQGSATGFGNFSFTGISAIVIDAGDGSDHVSYELAHELQPLPGGAAHIVQVNLRDGDDHFAAVLHAAGQANTFLPGSELLMKVVGERGNDQIQLDAVGVTMDHATMKIGFYGGEGNDQIDMAFSGLVDQGGISFFAFGNEDNDTIRLSMIADPASVAPAPGGFRGIIDAGDGNDAIFFQVLASSAVSTAQTSIDGGDAIDHALTNIDLGNVTNVEHLP